MPGITLLEAEVKEIIAEGGKVKGIVTTLGAAYTARAVIVATGVYLNAEIVTGEHREQCGPSGYKRAGFLTDSLISLGLDIRRFKTGTPARVLRSSIDFSKMEVQNGEYGIPNFSYMTDYQVNNSRSATYYTNRVTRITLSLPTCTAS